MTTTRRQRSRAITAVASLAIASVLTWAVTVAPAYAGPQRSVAPAPKLTPAQQAWKNGVCILAATWPEAPTGVPEDLLSADCPPIAV